jgi:photosystem II stability/assembly factor-like uncharacterized protein
MKRLSLLFLIVIGIISCHKKYQPRNFNNLDIQEFAFDSTSIRAIAVINKNTVYFAGSRGEVGFTTDAGKSWTTKFLTYQDSIIPNFRSIALNGKNVFALSIGNPALLYKISEQQTTLVYQENHEKVFYDAMQFFDENNGIAMGDATEDCLSVITTSDGGNSWMKIPCENLPKTVDGEAAFAASNTNIKIIGKTVWIATGGIKSRILKSTNMGKTWKIFETPIVQGNPTQGIYSIDFADKNNGIVIGGDYSRPEENSANKAMTIDGGKTWNLIAEGQNPNYKSCIQYVPNTNGKEIFAVGKTGVSFSNDAGNSWREISKEAYYSIQFANENIAWLSGNQKIGKISLK